MSVSLSKIAWRTLWAVGIIAVYWGSMSLIMWSLEHHPQWFIAALVIIGIPVVIVALKFYGREQQRRSAWSSVRAYAKGELAAVPEASPDQQVIGIAYLEEVLFRAVSISVNENGIRLDRPFRAVRPLAIPWESVQRIDTYDAGGDIKLKNQDSRNGARLFLGNMDRSIALYPWNSEFQGFVPTSIGRDHLHLTK